MACPLSKSFFCCVNADEANDDGAEERDDIGGDGEDGMEGVEGSVADAGLSRSESCQATAAFWRSLLRDKWAVLQRDDDDQAGPQVKREEQERWVVFTFIHSAGF